jgi:HEAT repeat protein
LRDQAKQFEKRGVQVLLVEIQEAYRIRYLQRAQRNGKKRPGRPIDRYIDGTGLWLGSSGEPAWPVVTDPAGVVGASYGVFGTLHFDVGTLGHRPGLFVIDRDGVIRFIEHYKDTQWAQVHEVVQILDDLEEKRLLIAALKGKNPELAETVSLVLKAPSAESKQAVPALSRALRDDRAEVRAGAAAGLGWLGFRSKSAVGALTDALADDNTQVRRLSAEALARIGPGAKSAAPALLRALHAADEQARREFAELLRRTPPSARVIFPSIVQRIEVDNEHVRLRSVAVGALERIGADAVPAIIDNLASPDAPVRINSAELLGRIGHRGKQAVSALVALLRKDPDGRVREAAAHALSRLPHYDPALIEALADADPRVRAMAASAIEDTSGFAHWEAVVGVIALLTDEDARVRTRAFYVLNHRADASIPTLIGGLRHDDPRIRIRTAELLARLAPEASRQRGDRLTNAFIDDALPALRQARNDRDAAVRRAAAEALKSMEALKKLDER